MPPRSRSAQPPISASRTVADRPSTPFGANGLAFDANQGFLYVASTSDSKIYRIPVQKDGSAGPMQLFASGAAIDASQQTTEALHGADGIMFDVRGNLYVCANSAQ